MNIFFVADGQNFITLSSQTEYAVLLGSNVSLICGFNLISHNSLDTVIIWQSPTGDRIKSDDHEGYAVDDGPDVVKLGITNADTMDGGLWNCTVQQQRIVALEIHLSVVCKLRYN